MAKVPLPQMRPSNDQTAEEFAAEFVAVIRAAVADGNGQDSTGQEGVRDR
ncbi:MAG: hypothetical protein WCP28_07460 [Actinomycetes bacterium]